MTIRLTKTERALFERASTRAGKNMSEYLRDLSLQAANETMKRRGA